MHELPVTQSILKIALEHAGKANSKRITDLHVVTGELSSMVTIRSSSTGTSLQETPSQKAQPCTFAA